MINVEWGVWVFAAERLSNLCGGNLSFCWFLVVLLLKAVIFLMTNELIITLEYQVTLLARVVDATRLLFVCIVGWSWRAGMILNAILSLMEFQAKIFQKVTKNLILEEFWGKVFRRNQKKNKKFATSKSNFMLRSESWELTLNCWVDSRRFCAAFDERSEKFRMRLLNQMFFDVISGLNPSRFIKPL